MDTGQLRVTRLLRVAFLAVGLAACRVPPLPPERYVPLVPFERAALGCYVFTDPGDTSTLRIRLDSTVTRVAGDSTGPRLILRQLRLPPRLARRFAASAWYQRGDSALFLDLSNSFSGYLFSLRLYPDSLAGLMRSCADIGGCQDPTPTTGIRVPCAT